MMADLTTQDCLCGMVLNGKSIKLQIRVTKHVSYFNGSQAEGPDVILPVSFTMRVCYLALMILTHADLAVL